MRESSGAMNISACHVLKVDSQPMRKFNDIIID